MKRVKTDWRSSLQNDTLVDLMRVKIDSPSIDDYDPSPAVSLWNLGGKRKRRPHVSAYRPRRKAENSGSDSGEWSPFGDSDQIESDD